MIDSKAIGEELKKYFNSINLQQKDIASRLGVSQQAVGALLNGKAFGKKTAYTWEKEFGIKSNWLLTGEGNMLTTEAASGEILEEDRLNSVIAALNRTHDALERELAEKGQVIDRLLTIIESMALENKKAG